jgi:hypothetical protein
MQILNRARRPIQVSHFALMFGLGWTLGLHAQLPPPMPVVSIHASDPSGTWAGDPAQFMVVRQGPTNSTLNVFYTIRGTATNGIDYAPLHNWVIIPAGERMNTIGIAPINNGQTDTRTVGLQLAPPPTMPPVNYIIGVPSNAVVSISTDSVPNIPPFVQIATPPNGARFPAPATVPICARADDRDGWVSTVEFFADQTSLGITTNNPLIVGPQNPFCLIWSNVPPGSYALRALATDNGGASSLSEPINVTVASDPPPPTNFPPVARISSPPNGTVFPAPANIPLFAFARDPDVAVASVEFFDGPASLGFGSNLSATATTAMCPTNVYVLAWRDAPLGSHVVRAKATDARGAWALSEPVTLTVVQPPPPPTNRPPLVSIVATDPIAIEGTNCWPWLGLTDTFPAWSNWIGGPVSCRLFTNCGPKNATFVVRRLGATNDDLTVPYAIGGTVTNGVDYVPLPGRVTIPAGERRAQITIVPLDDGPPDINGTVVLRLLPSANLPPNYLLGSPRAAAALILDSHRPRPGSGLLPDRCFHLGANGPDGAWFRIEYSSDMMNWVPVCTSQVVNGAIDFVDPDASADSARFYRSLPELNPPVD